MTDSTGQAEAPAVTAERRFMALLENLSENITVLDAHGQVLFSTRTLVPSLGIAPDQMVGRSVLDLAHPEDAPRAYASFLRVLAGEEVVRERFRVASAHGTWRTIEVSARNRLQDPDIRGVVLTARDVTDEVTQAEELLRSQEELRLMLGQMPAVLWTTDRDLRVTSLRGRAAESAAFLLGAVLSDLPTETVGADEMLAAHENALLGHGASYEVMIGGAPFEAHVEPLRSSDGITGVIGVAVDMSRHLETEMRLRVQGEVLQRILDNMPLMVALYDGAGNFIWVNRGWVETSGWTLEDTWRRDFLERAVPGPDSRERFRTVIATASGEWDDVQLRTRSGTLITLTWSSAHLPDGTCIGIGRDVTELRRAADRLRESEERFRLMIESSDHVFFYMHDVGGVFEYVSPSVQAVLGYTPGELVGRHYTAVIPHEDAGDVVERTNQALANQQGSAPYSTVNRHKDGRRIRIEITETPLIRDGRVVGMQGFGRDVTQLRRLEEQMQHAQKMDAVGRLAGGVAHDFNNILTVIDGNAEIGLLEPGVAEELRECLLQIRTASERGSRLTRQLLAFSRKQVVQRSVLDLNECVLQMHSMLRRLIGDHVLLHVDVLSGPQWVFADAGQVEQVLLNLAVNARDAMPSGGELHILTRPATAEDTDRMLAGDWILLEFRDNGEGIEPAVLPHIFEPFFTTRERGKGTGLGLATSYAIVEGSGGWIDVQSEPGTGARFRIFLPRSAPPESARPATASPSAIGGAECILLVEDDAAVRGVIRHTLRRHGYTLIEAEHGAAALSLLQQHGERVSLVISDVMMPVMGGVELAENVRRLMPDLPILFISGYTDDAPELGGADGAPLLHKPFTAQQLAGAVRNLLDDARVKTNA